MLLPKSFQLVNPPSCEDFVTIDPAQAFAIGTLLAHLQLAMPHENCFAFSLDNITTSLSGFCRILFNCSGMRRIHIEKPSHFS